MISSKLAIIRRPIIVFSWSRLFRGFLCPSHGSLRRYSTRADERPRSGCKTVHAGSIAHSGRSVLRIANVQSQTCTPARYKRRRRFLVHATEPGSRSRSALEVHSFGNRKRSPGFLRRSGSESTAGTAGWAKRDRGRIRSVESRFMVSSIRRESCTRIKATSNPRFCCRFFP